MTTNKPDATANARAAVRPHWPKWVSYAAAAWSAGYGLLGLNWALGGAGYPFAEEKDAGLSILADADPATTGIVIAAVGFVGTAVAIAMSRKPARRRGELLVFAWPLAAILMFAIPDYRPLLALIRVPMIVIGTPLGLVPDGIASNFFTIFLPWPVLNQLVLIVGGLFWAGSAIAYRRRLDDACMKCGRSPSRRVAATTGASAARWGRWAVAVAIAVPVGYATTRWAWALDIPLGMTQQALDAEAAESPGIWWAGAMLASFAIGGAILTLGLVQRWGEVYPRWIPRLRGRPVRPRVAIIPASIVTVLVTTTGLTYLRRHTLGGHPVELDLWAMYLPQLFFPLWGIALGAATLAYHLRRRGQCGTCGLDS